MIRIDVGSIVFEFDEEQLHFQVSAGAVRWSWSGTYIPYLECEEGNLRFEDALLICHEKVENGIGSGVRSLYKGFRLGNKEIPYAFETYVWIERVSRDVYFEWIPLCEEGLSVKSVHWPGEMAFDEQKENWYTLLTMHQGILIPNTWETELREIPFEGRFGTAGGYMPWFSQIRERTGYLAVCMTPWNAGYKVEHPGGGPFTHVGMYFEPSLGRMDYRRVVRYTFLDDCDYNAVCKIYRRYVKERGRLRTLKEKAVGAPGINKLIGCSFVHMGIKTYVTEESEFYDPEEPDKNNCLTTFDERAEKIRELHRAGAGKLYLHLDGWAQPGYDNQHPDYLPACEEAGGWEGMKHLADTLHEYDDLFGIHDQYRDYYMAAPSFDKDYACRLTDGTIPKHRRWAGGYQSYLCGTQASYYVRRNYSEIRKQGIVLDCAYLDVFTCNEGDECSNPRHRMSRQECCVARNHCFDYLTAQGILPSSEEASDWCIPSMVFCHYAPYDFMLRRPGSPRYGIPVPLFGLVYHDCLIVPWMMDKVSDTEDYMLYALLNGGAPYLLREGAYPNTDGSFDTGTVCIEENIERCGVVSALHEKVACREMLRHDMEGGDGQLQRTLFSDGTIVTVDFRKQTYKITYGRKADGAEEVF